MDALQKMKLAAQAMRQAMPGFPSLFEASSVDLREGEQYLRQGKHAEAERWFDQELANLKARGPMRARHARVLIGYATAQFRQAKFDDARETVETALDLLESTGHKRQPETATCLDLLGSIHLELGEVERAQEYFEQALAAEESARPREPANLALRHRRLAAALRKGGRMAEARASLTRALAAAEQVPGANPATRAGILQELGECESTLGNHHSAIEHLKSALDYSKTAFGADSEEVARCLQTLATASQASGDLEAAVGYYEQALRLRERQLGGNAADFAVLLMSLAGVHSLLGRPAPAMELLQQAVGKLQGVRDIRLGEALESLASVYLSCGRVDEALSSIRQARQFWESDPEANAGRLEANQALLERALALTVPEPAAEEDYGYCDDFDGPVVWDEPPAGSPAQPPPESTAAGPLAASRAAPSSRRPALPAAARAAPGAASGQLRPASASGRTGSALPPAPQGSEGVAFHFVRPDGSPVASPAGPAGPVNLTIVVPDGALPGEAVALPARAGAGKVMPFPNPPESSGEFELEDSAGREVRPAAAKKDTPPQPAGALRGWEELGFDLLPM